MDTLRVRAYNVRFGDAILISVPDRDPSGTVTTRHILIDVGNVLAGEGGQDALFQPVVDNILQVLDGKPLDLYIMTHEHMDHIQGLYYAESKFFLNGEDELRSKLNTQSAWLTASAADDYYESHPDAKKQHLMREEIYEDIKAYMSASQRDFPDEVNALLVNNNPRKTLECVDYLKQLSGHSHFAHRESDYINHHPFKEAQIKIWAPEENTARYYGHFESMALGVSRPDDGNTSSVLAEVKPPPGVDAGAFYHLVESRRRYYDNLLAIDKAANNTSIVFCLEWRGWRLLFPGDAEERSWKTMAQENVLQPVHFLKIGHHGSHNGTPDLELLEKILPMQPHDDKPRSALVSTFEGTYNNVPDEKTLEIIAGRIDDLVVVHDQSQPGGFVDLEFPG